MAVQFDSISTAYNSSEDKASQKTSPTDNKSSFFSWKNLKQNPIKCALSLLAGIGTFYLTQKAYCYYKEDAPLKIIATALNLDSSHLNPNNISFWQRNSDFVVNGLKAGLFNQTATPNKDTNAYESLSEKLTSALCEIPNAHLFLQKLKNMGLIELGPEHYPVSLTSLLLSEKEELLDLFLGNGHQLDPKDSNKLLNTQLKNDILDCASSHNEKVYQGLSNAIDLHVKYGADISDVKHLKSLLSIFETLVERYSPSYGMSTEEIAQEKLKFFNSAKTCADVVSNLIKNKLNIQLTPHILNSIHETITMTISNRKVTTKALSYDPKILTNLMSFALFQPSTFNSFWQANNSSKEMLSTYVSINPFPKVKNITDYVTLQDIPVTYDNSTVVVKSLCPAENLDSSNQALSLNDLCYPFRIPLLVTLPHRLAEFASITEDPETLSFLKSNAKEIIKQMALNSSPPLREIACTFLEQFAEPIYSRQNIKPMINEIISFISASQKCDPV